MPWNQSSSYDIISLILSCCHQFLQCIKFVSLIKILLSLSTWLLCLICLTYLKMMLLNDVISCPTHSIHHWHYLTSCPYLPHFPLYCIHTAPSQPHLWVSNLAKPSTDSSVESSSMASSLSQDLSHLSDHCVLAVYQLKQFELTNHVYTLLISNNIVSLAHSIITLYLISTDYQSSADTSGPQQICGNYSQPINLDYFISWSLTKSNLIKIIHCFKENSNLLLNHLTFLMWVSFQSVNNSDQFNQFDSFKIEWRLHQSLSSTLNQSDRPKSTASLSLSFNLSCEQSSSVICLSLSESHPHTFISVNKSIPCSPLLSQEMAKNNDNDSCHSSNQDTSLINSVFFNTQMQMLCSMIIQTKNKDCAEDCAEMINSASQHFKTTDLSHHSEQSYSDWWDLSQCHQYEPDSDNPDNSDDFNESASNLLNTSHKYCWTDEDTCFCSEEVNFFNSYLNTKDYESGDIINAREKIYFCDIYLFIDFFKNITHIKTDEVVHYNLNKCLCSIAQNWYIEQLSAMEHNYIWEGQGVEHWEEMLFQHFKWTQFNAMKMLKTECYTIQNIHNNCELSGFILNVIQHAKNADMINVFIQLTWVWNYLDSSLHESIWWSSAMFTMSFFIEDMENIKEIWFNKYNCWTESTQQPQQQTQLLCWQDNNFDNHSSFCLYGQFSEPQFPYNPSYQNQYTYNCSYQSYLSCSYNINVNVSSPSPQQTSYCQSLQIMVSNTNINPNNQNKYAEHNDQS